MIFDTDDLYEGHDGMRWLLRLKEANPSFRMTAFCVQARGSAEFWDSLPDWIECAAHGNWHLHSTEAIDWSYEKAMEVMAATPERLRGGWKSPGWQISDGTYKALTEVGWWVADQHYNDGRRPAGLRVHCEGDGDHVHTHVQNVCGNGLEELFPYLLDRVRAAETFELISEVVHPWMPIEVAA